MKHQATPKKCLLATALLMALAQTATAQDASQTPSDQEQATQEQADRGDPTELDKVVVSGIRGSLE